MKERLLFNRVSTDGGNIAVLKGVETSADVLSGSAEACLSFRNEAAPFTGKTLHLIIKRLIK